MVIENEILMLIRNNKKTKGEVYLSDPIGVDKEGNEYHLTCYTRSIYVFGNSWISKLSSLCGFTFLYSTLNKTVLSNLFFNSMLALS